MLKINGTLPLNHFDIQNHIVFYSDLFNSTEVPISAENMALISYIVLNLVLVEDNAMLTDILSSEEVKAVVFKMDASSAPGPDGFTGLFFQVGTDVYDAVMYFFIYGVIHSDFNSNFLILIPKVETTNVIENYRPIALGNFLFKVIIKIILIV